MPVILGCSAEAVVPAGLGVTKASGVADVPWLPPLGATRYRMRVGTAPGVDRWPSSTSAGTTAAVNLAGVAPGTYFVRVSR